MKATAEMTAAFDETHARVSTFGGPAHYPPLPTKFGNVVSVSLTVQENPPAIRMREVYAPAIGARATHNNVTTVTLDGGEMTALSQGSDMVMPCNLMGDGVVEGALQVVTSQPPGFGLADEVRTYNNE